MALGELQIDVSDDHVITVTGELDLATVPALQACIEKLLGQQKRDLRIDLSGVSFCDSTGIGTLVWAHNALSVHGQPVLINPSRHVAGLIAITGLNHLLDPAAVTGTPTRAHAGA